MRLKITGKMLEVTPGVTSNYEILSQLNLPNSIKIRGKDHFIKDFKIKSQQNIHNLKPGKKYNLHKFRESVKAKLITIFIVLVDESIESALNASSIIKEFELVEIKCRHASLYITLIHKQNRILYHVYVWEDKCRVDFETKFECSTSRKSGYHDIAKLSVEFSGIDAIAEKLEKDMYNLDLIPFGIIEIDGERIQV